MNAIRQAALRRVLGCIAVLCAVSAYLLAVDYLGAPFPTHSEPFFVALGAPTLWISVRAVGEIVTGRSLPRGWPLGLYDEDGDQRPMWQRMWSRPPPKD
jgi:hypothetical protein